MNEKGKLIMNPNLAVYLLKRGFTIIDIKPNRKDKRRSVFIFREEEGLNDVLTEYTSLKREEKEKLNKED